MNSADTVVLVVVVLAFLRGWHCGLLHALIGPISLFISLVVSIVYYDVSNNLAACIQIAAFGTIGLITVTRITLMVGRAGLQKEFRKYVFLGSRILGSITNMAWKTCLIIPGVLALSTLPPESIGTDSLQKTITASKTYTLTHEYIINRSPKVRELTETLGVLEDAIILEQITTHQEYEDLATNTKINEILYDENLQQVLREKDFLQLIMNPKIWPVLQDDALLKNLRTLSQRLLTIRAEAAFKKSTR